LTRQYLSIDDARSVIEDAGVDWLQTLGNHLKEYLIVTETTDTDDAIAAFDVVLIEVEDAITMSINAHDGAWLDFLLHLHDDLTYYPHWVRAEIKRQKEERKL
jgi:hypothetical protein